MPATAAVSAQTILEELKGLGSEPYKKVLVKHGVKEPVYGVKIEALKKIQKRVKTDYRLALELFDTGVYDAMYLAGLVADDGKMTKEDLRGWLKKANAPTLFEYTVAWVAAGSPHGWELGREWLESKDVDVAATGWATLGGVVAVKEDAELDLGEVRRLLKRVEKRIHEEPDRVRYVMNGFVIAVGSYVTSLTEEAVAVAKKVGTVSVEMGETACRVPDAGAQIEKVRLRGAVGKKRKTVKC